MYLHPSPWEFRLALALAVMSYIVGQTLGSAENDHGSIGPLGSNAFHELRNEPSHEIIIVIEPSQYSSFIDAMLQEQPQFVKRSQQIAIVQESVNSENHPEKLLLERRSPNETSPLTVFMFANYSAFLFANIDALLLPRNTWIFGSRSHLGNAQPKLSTNAFILQHEDELESDEGSFTLHEVFGIKNGTRVHVRSVSPSVLWRRDSSTVERRRNLNGLIIDVAHVLKPPIFTRTGSATVRGGNWGADLISYQILGYMQDYLNFTIQFHNTSTWVYAIGTPADGTLYGGMALMVREGSADLALSNTGIWPIKDFGFLYITRLYKEIFVYYHTTTQSASTDLFVEVFPFNVVICLAALFFITILAAFVFFSYEHRPQEIYEILSWAAAMFSQQGPPEPNYRRQLSGRLYLLTLLIFCVLFYACVSALLLAKLSFNEGINDVNALIRRGYKFGIWSDSILDNGFTLKQVKPSSPIYPVGKVYKPFATEPEGAAEVVRSTKFAFVSHQNWFLSYKAALLQLDICHNMKQLVIPDEKRWGTAFVHPKSEFRDHFNLARLRMAQVGLKAYHLRQLAQTIEDGKPSCYTSTESQTKSQSTLGGIYLEQVALSLYSLGVGFTVGLAMLTMELVHKRVVAPAAHQMQITF